MAKTDIPAVPPARRRAKCRPGIDGQREASRHWRTNGRRMQTERNGAVGSHLNRIVLRALRIHELFGLDDRLEAEPASGGSSCKKSLS
jgi:hypothetical protein